MKNIDIHLFSDVSINAVCITGYAVMYQANISQCLITSKSRSMKRNLPIPRLELIAPQMPANLSQNIKNLLNNRNVRNFYTWSHSNVVLHWLKDKGKYKVFIRNQVAKIRENSYLEWNYVQTRKNPADIGSRGCELSKLCEFWWDGTEWLGDCENWPQQPNITNKC